MFDLEGMQQQEDLSLLLQEIQELLRPIQEKHEANEFAWALFELAVNSLIKEYGTLVSLQLLANLLQSVIHNGPNLETELAGKAH